jgi:hypothetical protein
MHLPLHYLFLTLSLPSLSGTIEPWRTDCSDNKAAWEAVAAGQMAQWFTSHSNLPSLSPSFI